MPRMRSTLIEQKPCAHPASRTAIVSFTLCTRLTAHSSPCAKFFLTTNMLLRPISTKRATRLPNRLLVLISPLFVPFGEEGRAAPAPMHARDRSPALQRAGHQVDLADERIHVAHGLAPVLRRDLVARAVEAERVAEGDVHVEAERPRDAAHAPLAEP